MLSHLLLSFFVTCPPAADPAAPDLSEAYARAVTGFVTVQITRLEDASEQSAVGRVISGFVIDGLGHVITIGDPLVDAGVVVVELGESRVALARIVGVDMQSNLGVLQMDGGAVVVPEFGLDAGLKPAQPVLGIGNPYDLGVSASVGHVTGTGRSLEARGHEWTGLIQLSLPVHPGEQGGPLVDATGRVVGVVMTRLEADEDEPVPANVSFAVPIDVALDVARAIIERADLLAGAVGSKAPVPFLGVRVADLSDPALIAQARLNGGEGCVIRTVYAETAAERSGLRINDIVRMIDGQVVTGSMGLGRALLAKQVRDTVRLTIVRGGRDQVIEVVLEPRN